MADGATTTTPHERIAPGVDLIAGDCLDVLPTLAAESVHCVVTSPPYFWLRDYKVAPRAWPAMEYAPMAGLPPLAVPEMTCCLGLEPTLEAYVGHLLLIFREVARVLRADGTCWVNIGDTYAAGGRGGGGSYRTERRAWRGRQAKGWRAVPGLRAKNLCLAPWRFALAMQADGWVVRSDIVWAKRNPMPSSVRDRPTTAHEPVILFTRGPRYFYDADAIAEPLADPERRNRAEGESAYRGQAAIRPRGRSGNKVRKRRRDFGGVAGHHGNQAFGVPWEGDRRNKRSVWWIASQAYRGAHFATFPSDLAEPCILAGCPERGVVLDPFAGSGTVGAVARTHGRDAVLIEAQPTYHPLIRRRVAEAPAWQRSLDLGGLR